MGDNSLQALRGIGPRTIAWLAEVGIETETRARLLDEAGEVP